MNSQFFSRLFQKLQRTQFLQSQRSKIFGGALALSGLSVYNYWNKHKQYVFCDNTDQSDNNHQNHKQADLSAKNLFNSEEIRRKITDQIVLIYSERTSKPIATGIIIDDEGTFITVSNIFDLNDLNIKNTNHSYYVKSIRDEFDDISYPFSIDYNLESENISFCRINKLNKNQHFPFKKQELSSLIPTIGKRVYLFGKSNQDFRVIEEGILNENKLSSEQAFDFSASSLLVMANIQNKYTSLYGGPIFDELGNVLGMNYPIPNSMIQSHIIGVPSYFLSCIVNQYLQNKEVRRPYVGVSFKWTSDIENGGAFVMKVNSDSPGAKADLKLGEIITEVNSIKIKDGRDISRVFGYNIGSTFRLKVFRNGKSRFVDLTTE